MTWHTKSVADALAALGVEMDRGLSSEEAQDRLNREGPNQLTETGGTSAWRILWEQFTSTMALILTGAALLSFSIGSLRDGVTILAIVALFALLGFVQEFRAEQAMRALKQMAAPLVKILRNGAVAELPAMDIVPGDIVLLEAGNVVPADCRLVEAHSLGVQEALLTGEAEAVLKQVQPLEEEWLPVADRTNMVWMGTVITAGRGSAVAVATGMSTQMGHIAGMLQSLENQLTPLQRRLDRLGKILAFLAVAIAAVIFGIGLSRGEPLREMMMTAVSLAVAAIPEGLPAVVTITLAIGAQRMLKRRALIRRLPAVETLGSVTVICSDKTGTLTENRMTVTSVLPAPDLTSDDFNGHRSACLLAAAVLCNDAVQRGNGREGESLMGDPTETALLAAAADRDVRSSLRELFPRKKEIPFDSATKRMVTIHAVQGEGVGHPLARALDAEEGDLVLVAKGASDAILPICTVSAELAAAVAETVDGMAAQGERVLAFAFRKLPPEDSSDPETGLERLHLAGLIAMMDPPRREAADAVRRCLEAGIRPVMITGDHPLTAASIAAQVGILSPGGVLTGSQLDEARSENLAEQVRQVSIYSRVSPEHKLMIIEALQKENEVVAMTGDGVNDAPALKRANIGVAMGITGTDVAKESADMVLLDDNFATIVAAVEEGRTIYDNLRKFIEFSVAGNLGKILVVLVLPFLGLPNPLTPLQLLWLNLLTDGLLGLGMGMERAEPDLMRRAPISPDSQIFDRPMLRHTILTGALIGTSTILLARHYWFDHPGQSWQTVLFVSLALAQIGQALALRSRRYSLLTMGLFSNPLLLGMAVAVVALQYLVINLPVLQPYFGTVSLTPAELFWCAVPGILVYIVLEVEKKLPGERTSAAAESGRS